MDYKILLQIHSHIQSLRDYIHFSFNQFKITPYLILFLLGKIKRLLSETDSVWIVALSIINDTQIYIVGYYLHAATYMSKIS